MARNHDSGMSEIEAIALSKQIEKLLIENGVWFHKKKIQRDGLKFIEFNDITIKVKS